MSTTFYPSAIVEILSDAKNVVVITGSGISAPSGLPTFIAQPSLKEFFTYESLIKQPEKTWLVHEQLKAKALAAKPNAGHITLATFETYFPSFHLFTQNIDGLHQRAGSKQVTEVHGSLFRIRCDSPASMSLVDRSGLYLPVLCNDIHDFDEVKGVCRRCGNQLRHDIVLYGEALGSGVLDAIMGEVALCDFLLIVGTSGLVNPVNQAAQLMMERRMPVLEINLAPSLPQALTIPAKGDAARVLTSLASDLTKLREQPPVRSAEDYLRM